MKAPAEGGSLSVLQGTALTLAAVLGTGVISLPALAIDAAGPASLVAWAALLLISVPLAATFAALGARHPDGGGVSTYARLAFGERAATMVGWGFFLAIPIGAPVAAGFAASYVADAVGGGRTTEVVVTAAVIVVVAVMNWMGIQVSARVQLGIAAVIATLLLVAIVVSLPRVDVDNLTPFLTHGWSGVGAAAALLVWAFAGWEIVSSLSGEYRHPRRDIGRATATTLAVVTVLYLGIAFVTVAVLGGAAGRAPLADLLAGAFGDWARPLTTGIAVLLTVGAINAYFAGASRLGASLAITGAAPRWLGSDIGDGRRTPRHALAFVAGLGLVVTVGEAVLGQPTDATLLVTTGTFALVYVVGTAAAVRLLPGGWPRVAAIVSFVASVGLVVLTGPAVLLPIATGLAGLCWTLRRPSRARVASAAEPEPHQGRDVGEAAYCAEG
ncbi:amino acid permease [Nocardioides sp. HM23]|uniref:APC family permease n=1 Tax=Nocardioides bizhenqiangii TaxID=3095076 RepID=UPI002ACABF52|nr:amino acid permease [Nocardioides sp. HM23]MDZ5622318.1 amino acid permease [Nocardioides sp. HM23]